MIKIALQYEFTPDASLAHINFFDLYEIGCFASGRQELTRAERNSILYNICKLELNRAVRLEWEHWCWTYCESCETEGKLLTLCGSKDYSDGLERALFPQGFIDGYSIVGLVRVREGCITFEYDHEEDYDNPYKKPPTISFELLNNDFIRMVEQLSKDGGWEKHESASRIVESADKLSKTLVYPYSQDEITEMARKRAGNLAEIFDSVEKQIGNWGKPKRR